MTILEDHHIGDSVLFRAKVYDTDGETLVTPASVVCVVFNADTDAVLQSSAAGTVGAGYAQYNWSGNSSVVNVRAELTVTISSGFINTEDFYVSILGKPHTFTLLLSSSIGKVRRYLGDVRENDGVFFGGFNLADDEIQLALDNNGGGEYAAASECARWVAADWARLPRRIVVDSSLTIDRADTVKHWNDLADKFEAEAAGGGSGSVAIDRRDAFSVIAEKGGNSLLRVTDTKYTES